MADDYSSPAGLSARIAIHAYGTNPTPWFDFVRERLPLAPGQRVIDVGAGTGVLWEYDHGVRLTLLDRSAAMRADVRGDAVALPFADAAFDGAVANHMLYHLDDPAAGLAELRRVVRPGGWVAVATNGEGHLSGLGEDVHVRFPAETAASALAAFFDDVVVHRYEDTLEVPTAEPVVAYVESMAGRPLTREERTEIGAGPFVFRKNTVLVTAICGDNRPMSPCQ